MTETVYYIRARGKITGPYDVTTLQKLVRRGSLSRAHEVSQDRAAWNPAAEFEELFPGVANSEMTEIATPSPTSMTSSIPASPADTGIDTRSREYYYSQSGSTVGPLSVAVLRSLASNGTLRSDDLVWRQGGEAAMPAAQIPDLASLFSASYGALRKDATAVTAKDAAAAREVLTEVRGRSLVIGIVSGALIILFLNLPIASIDGRIIWWWDILRVPDTAALRVFCFYALLAGITLTILSPMINGIGRGVTFISITLLGVLLLLVVGLTLPTTDQSYVFGLFIPLITAAILATSVFRLRAPAAPYGVVWHGALGGCLVVTTLIVVVATLVQNDHGQLRVLFHRRSLPAWFIVALTLVFIGHLTGIVAGICALVSIKSKSKGLLRTTQVCGLISFIAPAPAIIIIVAGMLDFTNEPRIGMWMFLTVRTLAIIYAILVLLIAGFGELVNTIHFLPKIKTGANTARDDIA